MKLVLKMKKIEWLKLSSYSAYKKYNCEYNLITKEIDLIKIIINQ